MNYKEWFDFDLKRKSPETQVQIGLTVLIHSTINSTTKQQQQQNHHHHQQQQQQQ